MPQMTRLKKMKKKYCFTCGKELRPWKWKQGYDENTGTPILIDDWECPSQPNNAWNILFGSYHPTISYLQRLRLKKPGGVK